MKFFIGVSVSRVVGGALNPVLHLGRVLPSNVYEGYTLLRTFFLG